MVPGLGESFAVVDANVKYDDGATGFSSEHYRTGLGDVTWAPRTVDGKSAIEALLQALGHDSQPTQTAARRASLRGAKAQPLDHLACPLAVKRGGIEDHDAAISGPPNNGNDDAMPESKNTPAAHRINALDVLITEDFKAQCGSQRADYANTRRRQ